MPTLKVEQYKKWSSALPDGWKFDAQHYVMWGEKEIFTDSAENEKGVFYRLTLEYRAETENAGYFRKETGRQIPTVSVSRYTPTGSSLFSVVHILTEAAAETESKRNYNTLVKLAAALDVNDYFKRAAEKDTGKAYNDFSDFAGIVTDAAENSDSAEQEAAEETETAEAAENTTEEENAAETQENVENMPPYKCAEDMKAAFIADGWSADTDVREATAEEIEKSGHYIKSAAANGSKFYIMAGSGNMYDDHGKIVYYNIPANDEQTEDAQTVEKSAPEESTEDAPQENAAEDMTKEAAPDMFAQLAAAYFSGKAVKSKPRKAEQEPPKVEEPEPETVEEEAAPELYKIGWHENNNDSWKLTEDERKSLFCGFPVVRKERYNNGTWFSVAYSERVRMVYNVHSYDERDNVNPGRDASFCGFMIDGNIYSSDIRAIDAKYTEDINRYLLEHVKSETDAAHIAANIDSEYERGRLEELKERDFYDDAKRLFFDHKKPQLVLYWKNNDRETHGYDAIIEYLLEPEKAVETAALRYMCDKPQNIYSAWIKYNRLSATFDRINSDSKNAEHKLRRISECITDQKTVRIQFENGNEVKCEADAVKRIPYCGYISNYNFTASDRKYLPKDESGRNRDVHAEDIVCISHGGRVLYSA